MIKRLMLKRTFNLIIIILVIAVISGGAYFYISTRTNVNTLNAGSALIADILAEKGIFDSFNIAISNLSTLAMLQVLTFVIMTVSLLFLLWLVFRLYLIEQEHALIDSLTNIYNRRAIMLGLKKEIERSERFGNPLTVAMLDLDYFKQYNDANGHEAGDKALRKITKIIDKTIRKTDMLGRVGGEEFLIVFPQTSLNAASKICERIRTNILRAEIPFEHNLPGKALTASIGIAELHDAIKKHHTHDVYDQADKQLYLAKLAGRNCVR